MEKIIKPHIQLSPDPRFERAIVCGAPERAEKIAGRLSDVEVLAKNREYHSYLGRLNNQYVLVTSHGVGAAGAGICFQELIDVGVRKIIRLGTAGGLRDDSVIGEIVVPSGAVRKDGVSSQMVPVSFPAVPDLRMTVDLIGAFEKHHIPVRSGIVVSSDLFYPGLMDTELELFKRANAVAVEMECSALFVIGALRGIRTASALALDGNPLKWHEGHYNPCSDRLKESIDKSIDICLEVLTLQA